MATAPTQESLTKVERTFRANFETPRTGGYSLQIHRQEILTDSSGKDLAVTEKTFRYNEPISKTFTRPSAAVFLAACQNAQSLTDVMSAMSHLFDGLVAEVDAEKAAADAAKAQG
jgi:hypothetical protein